VREIPKFTPTSRAGLKTVTPGGDTKNMISRYAHKRIATLLTAGQTPADARVIEWPQKTHRPEESRVTAATTPKTIGEKKHAR
jgi:hypothetical protein